MYSKIAIGNVKKSFKDYSIYFLTLTLAVSIFYSFNSIESQNAMLEINSSTSEYIKSISQVISFVSIFVSVILGSLIVYANNFLIKKRKKELGIYMTLGMGKYKISKILIMETVVVGLFSLISGLLLGFVLSQGLSVFTASLFDVGMREYKFVFSISSLIKTVIYFGIMFLLVILFNTVVISRYKIIDLLTASRKNESIKFKNPLIYLITFIICLVSLVTAYKLIFEVGLNVYNNKFTISIGLGVIGTLLFFYSLSGALLYLVKKNKNIYFRGLNIFITKQINSKVNTNFLSMSVICLMLFLTMGILSTGISFKNALEKSLEETTPFDASASLYVNKDDKVKSIQESLDAIGFKFDDSEKYVFYNIYKSDVDYKKVINKNLNNKNRKYLSEIKSTSTDLLKLSDYNKIRELKNEKPIKLNDNEILFISNNNKMINIINDYLKSNDSVNVNRHNYQIKNKKISVESIQSSGFSTNLFTVVVNDKLTNNLDAISSELDVNFTKDKQKSEEKFSKLFNSYMNDDLDYDKFGFVMGTTKNQIYDSNKGISAIILFVGIYLGIIFLISSMAVLALQQLSEASDSAYRYESLKRIGANDKMINKSIFIQTLIYFSLPIGLAFVHSVVGIKVANSFISMFNKPDIGMSSLFTALVFLIIYIGYFYATYIGYKNIVKKS